jgi:purine-binding chemotaxis protein CheW
MTSNASVFPKKKEPVRTSFLEVERRLDAARVAVERIWTPSSEETQRILKARALALAQEASPQNVGSEDTQVVEFTLGNESYAIESHFIVQIACVENIMPLPCTPAFVLGMVNVRGQIFPVIDLKVFFKQPGKELTNANKVIVLQSGKVVFSILAEEILGLRHIPVTDILPTPPTLTGTRKNYLKGITSEPLMILDAAKLLLDESIFVDEQVTE